MMGEEERRIINDCDDAFEILPSASDCVDDETVTSLHQTIRNVPQEDIAVSPPYDQPSRDLSELDLGAFSPNNQPTWDLFQESLTVSPPNNLPTWDLLQECLTVSPPNNQPRWDLLQESLTVSPPNNQPRCDLLQECLTVSPPNDQPTWDLLQEGFTVSPPNNEPTWDLPELGFSVSPPINQPTWDQSEVGFTVSPPLNQPTWDHLQKCLTASPTYNQAWDLAQEGLVTSLPYNQPTWDLPEASLFNTPAEPSPCEAGLSTSQAIGPFLAQKGPCLTQTDLFIHQSGTLLSRLDPPYTQPDPSDTRAGPNSFDVSLSSSLAGGPFTTEAGLCPTPASTSGYQSGTLTIEAGPSHSQTGLPLAQTGSSLIQSSSSHTQAGPSHTQAGPPHTQTGPSHILSDPSHNQVGPSHKQTIDKLLPLAFNCSKCNMIFKNKYNLSRHIHSAHEDTTLLQCDLYKKHFQRKRELLYHIKNKSELDNKCSKCGKMFSSQKVKRRHMKFHCPSLREQFLLDNICDESAESNVDINLQTKTFKCKYCKHIFTKKHDFIRHIKCEHDIDPKFFECGHCGKYFTRSDRLSEHIKTIHTDRKTGDQSFPISKKRSLHSKYACPSPKENPLLDTVDEPKAMDVDVDTDEVGAQSLVQSAVVETCPSTATSEQPSNLNHGCECPKCGHKYIHRDSLTRHLRVECGIPPRFICSLCHYKTHFKYNLQKHIVRVHEWELHSPQ